MTATTKAVILARGVGSRMRRLDPTITIDTDQAASADAGIKGMIPFGRPFLDFVISALALFFIVSILSLLWEPEGKLLPASPAASGLRALAIENISIACPTRLAGDSPSSTLRTPCACSTPRR